MKNKFYMLLLLAYTIDGANGIKNPVGMFGSNLEVEFIISTIGINHYKNYIECVTKCNVDIGQVIFFWFSFWYSCFK